MMQVTVITLGVILVLLGYSWYELLTSRWEREDQRVHRFQLALFSTVTLDLLWLVVPDLVGWRPIGTVPWKAAVILGGAVPLVAGGMVALRKGPARIAMPAVCLFPLAFWSLAYYMAFIFVLDAP